MPTLAERLKTIESKISTTPLSNFFVDKSNVPKFIAPISRSTIEKQAAKQQGFNTVRQKTLQERVGELAASIPQYVARDLTSFALDIVNKSQLPEPKTRLGLTLRERLFGLNTAEGEQLKSAYSIISERAKLGIKLTDTENKSALSQLPSYSVAALSLGGQVLLDTYLGGGKGKVAKDLVEESVRKIGKEQTELLLKSGGEQVLKDELEKISEKKIGSSVLQIVDKQTNKVEFKVIPKNELENFKSLIDSTDRGIAGTPIDNKIYHLTAKTPEAMTKTGAKYTGIADAREIESIISKTESSLLQEAKKYKSADEFISKIDLSTELKLARQTDLAIDNLRKIKINKPELIDEDGLVTLFHGGKFDGNILKATDDELFFLSDSLKEATDYAKNKGGKVIEIKTRPEFVSYNIGSGEFEISQNLSKIGDPETLDELFAPTFTKSQLTDIWNKANKTTPETSLIAEAKKYKSADEFVKAMTPELKVFKADRGIIPTANLEDAIGNMGILKKYPELKNIEIKLSRNRDVPGGGFAMAERNGKTIRLSNRFYDKIDGGYKLKEDYMPYLYHEIEHIKQMRLGNAGESRKTLQQLREIDEGYVDLRTGVGDKYTSDLHEIEASLAERKFLTKSQLIDIWNKANKKVSIGKLDTKYIQSKIGQDLRLVETKNSLEKLSKGLVDGLPEKARFDVVSSYTDNLTQGDKSVNKIIDALTEAKPLRKQQETIYTKERGKRLAGALNVRQNIKGEAGFFAEKAQLKGEIKKVEFESIRNKLSQGDIDNLFTKLTDSPLISDWDKFSAREGLSKLLGETGGKVPTKGEINLLNKVFGEDFTKAVLDKRTFWEKLAEGVYQTLNVPRSIMASFDLSAPFRQGIFLIGKPKRFLQSFVKMFKTFGSEKSFKVLMSEIDARPTRQLMSDSGLSLTSLGTNLTDREEVFMSNWAEKIPVLKYGIRASERAYVGFLNKLRADVFDDFIVKAANVGLDLNADRDLAKCG